MDNDDDCPPLAVPFSVSVTDPLPEPSAVGITVITGYLGSGKSTLINYILNAEHGKKIAVILNEFGEEIGVEKALINEGEGGACVEEWIELANGCVCCTVKHSLVQALEQLVQKKIRLDHILLETTGLADPAPLASIFWLDDQLESSVRLDSIITVVDAKNILMQLDEHRDSASFPEAFLQIAFADVVILNKVDLIPKEECKSFKSNALGEIEKAVHDINSLANIIPTVRCQVDLSKILDREAYGAKHLAHLEALLQESKATPTRSRHDYTVRTLCIYEDQAIDLSKVREWLEDLLWENKSNMDVYRCKGVLYVNNSDQLHTLQAVKELYEVVPARKWHDGEKQTNKIVFIGRNLNEEFLRDSFKCCGNFVLFTGCHLDTTHIWNRSVGAWFNDEVPETVCGGTGGKTAYKLPVKNLA